MHPRKCCDSLGTTHGILQRYLVIQDWFSLFSFFWRLKSVDIRKIPGKISQDFMISQLFLQNFFDWSWAFGQPFVLASARWKVQVKAKYGKNYM